MPESVEFIGEIKEIVQQTHDVKSFRITKPADFTFTPGQFCMVSLVGKEGSSDIAKPLTFSSSPTDEHIELTVKEVGTFTKALLSLSIGDKVKINGPRGLSLNFYDTIHEDIVFLSGGSGITPFMSITKYAFSKKVSNKFTLLYGNRTSNDIIFKKELTGIESKWPNLKVVHVLSNPEAEWNGERGYIDKEKILKHVDLPEQKIFYICGPPAMNKVAREILSSIGIKPENIKYDKWEIPGKAPIQEVKVKEG